MKTIIANITGAIRTAYTRFGNTPFLFILFGIVALYAFFNGPAMFPNWGSSNYELILAYGFMIVVFMIWAKKKTSQEVKKPLFMALPVFALFFFGTWIILITLVELGWLTPLDVSYSSGLFIQIVLIQICVVSLAEELAFRGVILDWTGYSSIGIIIQAFLFAIWHAYAYEIRWYNQSWETLNWGGLFLVFLIGVVLGVIAKQKMFGLPATMAIHACWNLVVLGVLIF